MENTLFDHRRDLIKLYDVPCAFRELFSRYQHLDVLSRDPKTQ